MTYLSMVKYRTTPEEYREAVLNSFSITGVCNYLGIIPAGGNFQTIKRNIVKYGLDTSHFTGQAHTRGKILVENPIGRETIKRRLIQERGHRCEKCLRTEWFDIPITLEVDHINGDSDQNDFSNLKLLCPNCHSQTPTWRRAKSSYSQNPKFICPECNGKKQRLSLRCQDCYQARKGPRNSKSTMPNNPNYYTLQKTCSCGTLISDKATPCTKCAHKKQLKIDWPDTDVIIAGIRETYYSAMGRKLGVSDNAIRKYLKNNGVDPKTLKPVLQ